MFRRTRTTHPATRLLLLQIAAMNPRADRFHTWGVTR